MNDLFTDSIVICPGMVLLPGFADSVGLEDELYDVLAQFPLRQMQTWRGDLMSVLTFRKAGAV